MRAMSVRTVRQLTTAVAFLVAVSAAPGSAYSAVIQPNSATPSSEFTSGFDGRAVHTIDASGLGPGFTPATPHDAYASGNHWTTDGSGPTDEFITWGFTTPQTLDTIYIWNHQSTTPTANNTGYDVTLFDLTVFALVGGISVPWLTLNDVALAPDTATAQAFSFDSPIPGVTAVRFDIEAVQSSTNFTGLAEVAFNTPVVGGPVPEPSTLLLLGSALAGFAAWRRRRP